MIVMAVLVTAIHVEPMEQVFMIGTPAGVGTTEAVTAPLGEAVLLIRRNTNLPKRQWLRGIGGVACRVMLLS